MYLLFVLSRAEILSYYHGLYGLQQDAQKAVELWTEASELGSMEALYDLGNAYRNGVGIEQDGAKRLLNSTQRWPWKDMS